MQCICTLYWATPCLTIASGQTTTMKWACCGLLWVVCLSIIMGCNADNNSEYERLQAEYVLPASALVEEVTNSRLPASRPKAPKGGWKMCTYKT